VVEDGSRSGEGLDRLRDRVEALGGWLMIGSDAGRGTRVSGSLPLSG
jgi:signal transduction histidine kinase